MNNFVPVCRPYLWGREKEYLVAALEEGWISSKGRFLDEFERNFARKIGTRFAIAVTSGTTALHLALDVLGINRSDEVIVPDFTMMAPIFGLCHHGAQPVPIDADATWNIDPALIEEAITPRTKAILAVHTYGHPARIDAIQEIARQHKLFLIEDAAEALGADLGGRQIGGFGDIACFSFYANKVITTGEGGMLVTNNPEFYELARWKRNMCFGKDLETQYTHQELGYNFRMTNIQAAIGLAQLEHIEAATAAKIAIADRYRTQLEGIPGLTLPPQSAWATNVYWVFGILVGEEFGIPRSSLQRHLSAEGIETRRFFTPLHLQPFFSDAQSHRMYPQAEKLFNEGLYLPSFVGMEEGCIDRIAETIRRIQSNRAA